MTDNPAPPDTLPLPAPGIARVDGALVMPVDGGEALACGVLGPDGALVPASRTLVSANRLTGLPEAPDAAARAAADHLAGRHLFAGLGRHHFGHFLLECIPRLWALDGLTPDVDGIVILPMPGIDFAAVLRRRLGDFLDLLTGGLPVHLIDTPTRVDQILVPTQGIGHKTWAVGTPQFRTFMRDRISAHITPDGPERLYISRSKLKSPVQMVDQERRIERSMTAEGYTVFHPQRHTIIEQCQRYMAAKLIVGPDGSAFHLAPFAARPGTRIGLIQRRWRQGAFHALACQVEAFGLFDVVRFNPLVPRDELPADAPVPEPPPLNLRYLKRALRKAGFFPG